MKRSQEFNFPFVLVPHKLEGSLGYATAVAASSVSAHPRHATVSLDVGGGSFQVELQGRRPA